MEKNAHKAEDLQPGLNANRPNEIIWWDQLSDSGSGVTEEHKILHELSNSHRN